MPVPGKWNSPYDLCAYDRYYRDYYPFYTENENGDLVEVNSSASVPVPGKKV